jgi:endo-1,4-beta-xylanase
MTAWPFDAGGSAGLSLAEAARLSGRTYGAAVRADYLKADAPFREAVLRECGQLTPELELKWAAVEPRRGELRLEAMDDIIELARRHALPVHGHTLMWHRSIPAWAQAALAQAPDWRLMRNYFGSVMPRYGEIISAWDVVNEPLDPAGPGGLRQSPFLLAFGPDYPALALRTARGFAPSGRLMINEYGLEYDDAEGEARRTALLRLLDRLHGLGAPLDGIGLQSHLQLSRGRLPQPAFRRFLGELAGRGLDILITELDVKERDYILPAERRDAAVAAAVRGYLDVALEEPRVRGVTTWGLSDRYSWLEVTPDDLRRWPNAWHDGTSPGLNRGLPLDAALQPKPMRQAMIEAFRHAGGKSA